MAKNNITREMLKNNFLRQTILRIDYDYLFPDSLTSLASQIDEELKKDNYTVENKSKSEVDLFINIDNMNQDEIIKSLSNTKIEKEDIYFFTNQNKNIFIEIGKEYSSITVNHNEYINFNVIKSIMNLIISKVILVKNNIQLKRWWLRKINALLLDDINKLSNLFEKNTLYIKESYNLDSKNNIETYILDNNYVLNLITNISKGMLSSIEGNQDVYQVMLDLDVYQDQTINPNNIDFDEMNNIIFEVYKDSLTEEFLSSLTKEEFNKEGVFLTW